jgi:hypothetical protein
VVVVIGVPPGVAPAAPAARQARSYNADTGGGEKEGFEREPTRFAASGKTQAVAINTIPPATAAPPAMMLNNRASICGNVTSRASAGVTRMTTAAAQIEMPRSARLAPSFLLKPRVAWCGNTTLFSWLQGLADVRSAATPRSAAPECLFRPRQ